MSSRINPIHRALIRKEIEEIRSQLKTVKRRLERLQRLLEKARRESRAEKRAPSPWEAVPGGVIYHSPVLSTEMNQPRR